VGADLGASSAEREGRSETEEQGEALEANVLVGVVPLGFNGVVAVVLEEVGSDGGDLFGEVSSEVVVLLSGSVQEQTIGLSHLVSLSIMNGLPGYVVVLSKDQVLGKGEPGLSLLVIVELDLVPGSDGADLEASELELDLVLPVALGGGELVFELEGSVFAVLVVLLGGVLVLELNLLVGGEGLEGVLLGARALELALLLELGIISSGGLAVGQLELDLSVEGLDGSVSQLELKHLHGLKLEGLLNFILHALVRGLEDISEVELLGGHYE